MRNPSKFNVRQFRNLLFCRAENTVTPKPLLQLSNPEAPKFWSSIRSACKTPKTPFTCSTTLLHFSTNNKGTSKEEEEESEEEFFRSIEDATDDTNDTDDVDVDPEFWEEEDEAEPELGDGGDGGGVVLRNCSWGLRALSLAKEALRQLDDDDLELFAFKTSPIGYVYVRIDKLSTEYGCPNPEVLEEYNRQYKKMLDEAGEFGELPDDLGLEVSSPGADRLLKVPGDLQRFKDMRMIVNYTDESEKNCKVKTSVFYLEAIDMETETCTWKLADVKENRDPAAKGKPLNRKQKDWRLQLPFTKCNKVMLYLA